MLLEPGLEFFPEPSETEDVDISRTEPTSEDHVARGLENEDGANHCFLNVAIQAFWNLRTFRTRFLNAPEHTHSWEPRVTGEWVDAAAVDHTFASGAAAPAHGKDAAVCLPVAVPALAPRSPGPLPKEHLQGSQGGAADDTCCYCALKSLFTHYRYSEQETLPPDSLRKALSHIYTGQGRFQLGEMEDATETIEVLLDVLHASSVSAFEAEALEAAAATASGCFPTSSGASSSNEPPPQGAEGRFSGSSGGSMGHRKSDAELVDEASNFPCQPLCIAHEVFGIEYVDVSRCTFCGSNAEPSVTGSFLLPVYVADMLALDNRDELGKKLQPTSPSLDASSFGVSALWSSDRWGGSRPDLHNLLWRIHQRSTPKARCAECHSLQTMVSERWLTRRPCTMLLSLVWPDSKPTRETLWWVLSAIQPVLAADRIFQYQARDREREREKSSGLPGALPVQPRARERDPRTSDEDFVFCGMICYAGMHYIAIFWCWARMQWNVFDDKTVRQERDWSSVVSLILNGSYVPTLLFHERCTSHGSEVSQEFSWSASVEALRLQIQDLEDRGFGNCSTM